MTDFTAIYAAIVQAVLLGGFAVLLFDSFVATLWRRIALAAMVGAAAMLPFASGASFCCCLPLVFASRANRALFRHSFPGGW